ncbi:uncharacterized protein LOC111079363 [Drosophila obscura]|uniref:uncharacterized protein LOC111079363 n=1 Tax=Drosophila obscura TaxID=7282 RepID=UPI001BB20255|nr:uncharacterized protein LOC111079363 [Drosophila obscura]
MDFDNAKENIQPLASGRNVSLLQASLAQDTTHSQELLAQRKKMEQEVQTYNGSDPLEPWYTYICWIEQSYPAGGSGSGLQTVLYQCLTKFEQDERYRQDRRLIKLFIKFMEKQEDQIECYQQLYNSGIGTMLADFYIAWAYSYDLSGNMRKADEIFRLGLECRAAPLEELQEAHQHFGYTVGQRMLYSDGDEADAVTQELNERRLALQSLHGRRARSSNTVTVGSVRTGAAVKSHLPGVVQNDAPSTSRVRNAGRNVEVFSDENNDINIPPPVVETEVKSSLRSIIDAARGQENLKEPVAWNKAHAKPHKPGKIFGRNATPELAFDIHMDEQKLPPITNYERNMDKPFKLPPNFVAKNRPQEPWVTPVTIEDEPNTNGLPCYHKSLLYPRPNLEFSPEEYRAYCFLKRRDAQHQFVLRNDEWWGTGHALKGIRRYPNFASASKPQPRDELDQYWKPVPVPGLQVVFDKLYNDEEQQEYQAEELLAAKWLEKRNVTVHGSFDMEETVCLPGNKMPRRKSFFPPAQQGSSRKSVMPPRVSMVKEEEDVAVTQDEPSPVAPAPPPQPKMDPKIEIFEDSDPTPVPPKPDEDNFAMPAPPASAAPPPLRQIEIYEDSEDPMPPSSSKPPPSAFFDADETCSTQMFNMFIKNQAVSTPKGTQKQAPARQFGTVLKELPPDPEQAISPAAASVESPVETRSPNLRKQLSTILETSEHGTHSSAATTTKSTITSTASSPGSHTALPLTSSRSSASEECTPAAARLQRLGASELSTVGEEPERQSGGNFSRRELWEPNAPSVPMMKSLRFQEDKTETIPRTLPRFQEDKTETLPRLPTAMAEVSLHQRSVVGGPSHAPQLPTLDDEDDLCGLFGKTPPKLKGFGSPLQGNASSKRICVQTTPDFFGKSIRGEPEGAKSSFAMASGRSAAAPSISKLADSFMTDLSFVAETQPAAVELMSMPKPASADAAASMQKKFEIFLDETMPEAAAPSSAAQRSSFTLDCTLPETQMPMQKDPVDKQETFGPAHLMASFMKDCTELSSCAPPQPVPVAVAAAASTSNKRSSTALKFLSDSMSKSLGKSPRKSTARGDKQSGDYFELNAATEMFATNISMIKNSTLLPPPVPPVPVVPARLELPAEAHADADKEAEMSIYYKKTPLTPKQSNHSWAQADFETPPNKVFVHPKANVDQSVLNGTLADSNLNPFNVDLINSLLDSIDFSMYIEKLPHCQLVGNVKRLQSGTQLELHGEKFDVGKIIGKGAYGSVFAGRHGKSGKKMALKQERPTNYWEFYICLEVHSRLTSDLMIPAFMHIDYALVGNNSSVYITELSEYGSLINVCNKIKKHTNKNLDEYVVMHMSCQLLDIVDHLHAIGIIHADIKPDNILVMRPLCAQPNELSLQLIDFGVAIDTKLFPPNQAFNYVHHDESFKCIEMRTQRPWTYQLDLFGLVSVMHVLLFGRYMEVAQRQPSGIWMPKTALPRYFQRDTWETIFRGLLNVRDCRTMPNLQQFRALLKSELVERRNTWARP